MDRENILKTLTVGIYLILSIFRSNEFITLQNLSHFLWNIEVIIFTLPIGCFTVHLPHTIATERCCYINQYILLIKFKLVVVLTVVSSPYIVGSIGVPKYTNMISLCSVNCRVIDPPPRIFSSRLLYNVYTIPHTHAKR